MKEESLFLFPGQHAVSRAQRSRIKSHQPLVLWFTGLSGSGKSSVANALELCLNQDFRAHTYLLDGDSLRNGLNRDLGFSAVDRSENIRRVGEVCKLMYDAGLIVLTAFISPFRQDRELARALIPSGGFWEIFIDCPLEVCIQRDPKELYKKALAGELPDFTGIHSPYEAPLHPELRLDSHRLGIEECVAQIIAPLRQNGVIQ